MSAERESLFSAAPDDGAPAAYDRFASLQGWEKLACGCYAEWTGDRWQIAASSFLCDHKQGDPVDGAPPDEDDPNEGISHNYPEGL